VIEKLEATERMAWSFGDDERRFLKIPVVVPGNPG
jgi:hypothetical protein